MILENYDPSVPELIADIFCNFAAKGGIDVGYDGSLDFFEMDRLEEMIRERHPDWPYTRRELNGGQQICFLSEDGHIRLSAVLHHRSYGHERGLIEFWDRESNPVIVDAEYALILFEKALKDSSDASVGDSTDLV